jgi:2-isopropylmalate synthase
VNLRLLGLRDDDLSALPAYAEAISTALGIPIPPNAPVVGQDAFRTATGVHAAAVIKAHERMDTWLADNVYSGVPASWIGREQTIDVGPMSGASNVRFALKRLGLATGDETVAAVLKVAKESDRTLSDSEIRRVASQAAAGPPR